jgi:hypothetical protein
VVLVVGVGDGLQKLLVAPGAAYVPVSAIKRKLDPQLCKRLATLINANRIAFDYLILLLR